MKTIYCLILGLALFLVYQPCSHGAFNEQMAVDTRAIALTNSCTADPPGLMSAHYNPAGLSQLDDGKFLSQGFVFPFIERTGKFKEDPDFEGFMEGTWGPNAPYNPDDPLSAHGGPDPLRDTEGTNNRNRMYIPFYGPVDMLVGANLGVSSKKKDSKWTFAYTNYAPYGGGMAHREGDDPMRFGCKALYLQHLIYAAPTASYQLSDTLSVGVSIGMGQTAIGMEIDQRTPNELVAMTRVIGDATKDLEIPVVSEQTLPPPFLGGGLGPYEYNTRLQMDLRDDFTPSFNLGLLWKPRSWFSFGICYQSQTKADLTGTYKFEYSEQFQQQVSWNGLTDMTVQNAGMLNLPIKGVPSQHGTATGTQYFPQRVQTGIMLKPTSKLKLLFDLHWADWSVAKEDRFVCDQDIQLFQIAKLLGYTGGNRSMVVKREMEDTWHWSVGIEYQLLDKLCLRAGYERRPTSARNDLWDALYFVPDMEFFGAGVGLKLPKNMSLDISFGYLCNDSHKIDNNQSSNMNSTDFTQIVYNPYAGLDYEQELYLYIASFAITMPLEVQAEMLHHQMQMMEHTIHSVKKLVNKINPFHKGDAT
ncbi:MAG: hypothetical protein GY737_23970 [Desulfobacteraceae bacterium]|nr:hypothetical protein [Desulfobacteraceae bacterium]